MRRPASEEALPESDAYPGARHPRLAPGVIGHVQAQAEMLGAYRSGRLAAAWLISGPEGVGKATLAWAFARLLLTEAQAFPAPWDHPAARQLGALSHPDVGLIRRAWNPKSKGFFSEIRIEDVREGQNLFRLAAASGGYRVLIVDAADDLNRSGANALLKTIEEPPARAITLIIAHRPGRLPPTIRSRCRRLTLEPLAPAEVAAVVRAQGAPWSDLPQAQIHDAAAQSHGAAREALRQLDPAAAEENALIAAVVKAWPASDPRPAARLAEACAGSAETHERFVLAAQDWLAARIRQRPTPALADLWTRIRSTSRDTEALNLDRRIHTLALLREISERA